MRSVVPSNLYQELATWHRDIDDLFRQFFAHGGDDRPQPLINWAPSLEVYEKDGNYVVRADLPGVDPKEVELSVVNDTLVLKGERKRAHEVSEKNYQYTETAYGRFERRLALPSGIDREKISARFEHGVLEIAVPLPASATARKVPIEISTGETKKLQAA